MLTEYLHFFSLRAFFKVKEFQFYELSSRNHKFYLNEVWRMTWVSTRTFWWRERVKFRSSFALFLWFSESLEEQRSLCNLSSVFSLLVFAPLVVYNLSSLTNVNVDSAQSAKTKMKQFVVSSVLMACVAIQGTAHLPCNTSHTNKCCTRDGFPCYLQRNKQIFCAGVPAVCSHPDLLCACTVPHHTGLHNIQIFRLPVAVVNNGTLRSSQALP